MQHISENPLFSLAVAVEEEIQLDQSLQPDAMVEDYESSDEEEEGEVGRSCILFRLHELPPPRLIDQPLPSQTSIWRNC